MATQIQTVRPERPLLRLTWDRIDFHRIMTGVALGGAVAALALALWGLPPVDLHGPLHRVGIMDFLCGGTRAAYFTVTGDWDAAWYYNPIGPLAVVGAALAVLRALAGLATGRWLNLRVAWTRRRVTVASTACAVLVIALTVRQQLMVDVLL